MKVLVTGANVHVGYNLCKALLAKGRQVRASIRNASDRTKAGPLQSLGVVELVGLDIRREDEFAKAVDGVDLLFHVAATYAYYTGSKAKDEEIVEDLRLGLRDRGEGLRQRHQGVGPAALDRPIPYANAVDMSFVKKAQAKCKS